MPGAPVLTTPIAPFNVVESQPQPQGASSAAPGPEVHTIAGVVRDNTGAPVAGAVVEAWDADGNYLTASTVSDASGRYSVGVTLGRQYQLTAYLPGAPDKAGITVNTLTGTP